MHPREGLAGLQEAKRLLALQGDIHRALLRQEYAALRKRYGRLAGAPQTLSGSPVLLAGGAVLAGLLVSRYRRAWVKWIPPLLTVWRWWRTAGRNGP